jgi:23S rRNA pseudouridine1911/1915/1917 synthase
MTRSEIPQSTRFRYRVFLHSHRTRSESIRIDHHNNNITSDDDDDSHPLMATNIEFDDEDNNNDDDDIMNDDNDDAASTDGDDDFVDVDKEENVGENNNEGRTKHLPEGLPKGFYVVQQFTYYPKEKDDWGRLDTTGTTWEDTIVQSMNTDHVYQLGLSNPNNITLPIALTILDPITYPSLSRARKACRKGNVLIVRTSATTTTTTNDDDDGSNAGPTNNVEQEPVEVSKPQKFIGRVGDRVYTGDTIGIQVRMGDGYSFAVVGHKQPPFDVPVIYQDDHYALVNKPAGVVCYRQGSGGSSSSTGFMSIRAALPFILRPPRCGTYSVLRRPASVHRLDKPTSGLLCVVKTKPAMVHMSRQFHDRIVQKTYTAIINGIPEENSDAWITTEQAILEYGFHIDCVATNSSYDCHNTTRWQLIDARLDDQHAMTLWRVLQYVPSLKARDGYITWIECKPKTGRYHQLRRHMAWIANRAIVGDTVYDGNHPSALPLRGNGLFLCATGILHEHPYYNTIPGRLEWDHHHHRHGMLSHNSTTINDSIKKMNDIVWYNARTDKVMVSATIEPPTKFQSLLQREEHRYQKFSILTTTTGGKPI